MESIRPKKTGIHGFICLPCLDRWVPVFFFLIIISKKKTGMTLS